jgi:hypothetical protein
VATLLTSSPTPSNCFDLLNSNLVTGNQVDFMGNYKQLAGKAQ